MIKSEIIPESVRKENAAGHAPLKHDFSAGRNNGPGETIGSVKNINAAAATGSHVLLTKSNSPIGGDSP